MGRRFVAGFGRFYRGMFISLRPGYMLFNCLRDSARTAVNLPGLSAPLMLLKYQAEALGLLTRMYRGDLPDVIQDMFTHGELIASQDRRDMAEMETQLDRMMQSYNIGDPEYKQNTPAFMRFVSTLTHGGRAANAIVERLNKVAARRYLDDFYPDMDEAERLRIIREQVGSPDFLARGDWTFASNVLLTFSNAAVQGWRSDIRALKDPTVMAKRIGSIAMYHALIQLAKRGLLEKLLPDDDDRNPTLAKLAAMIKRMSTYDVYNYVCVPLALTDKGRTLYFRIPMDEASRAVSAVIGSTVDQMIDGGFDPLRTAVQAVDIGAEQFPNVIPFGETLFAAWNTGTGQTHRDWFTQQEIIDRRLLSNLSDGELGTKVLIEFGKWAWQKNGGGRLYRPVPEYRAGEPREAEGFPAWINAMDKTPETAILSDIFGRFLKISDRGLSQAYEREIGDELRRNKDAESWYRSDLARKYLDNGMTMSGVDLSDRERAVWNRYAGEIRKKAREMRSQQGQGSLQQKAQRSTLQEARTIRRFAAENTVPE